MTVLDLSHNSLSSWPLITHEACRAAATRLTVLRVSHNRFVFSFVPQFK
jgi:hypothetical protein